MVKLPVSGGSMLTRDEIRIDGEPGDPPEAATDLVRALVRRAPVRLVARLTTLRRRVVLYEFGGRRVAELVDDEVSVLDGMRLAARFRELEVEFEEDAPKGLAESIAASLRHAGAGAPTPVPKIVRALGPPALEPPDVGGELSIDPEGHEADLVRRSVADAVARLVAHDPGVRLGGDSEDVHQARVATRRLRSDLRTFRELVDASWAEALRDELAWLGGALGELRDADVMWERLEGRLLQLPAQDHTPGDRVLARLSARRAHARTELLVIMQSDRYVALLDRLVDATRSVPPPPPSDASSDDRYDDELPRPATLVRGPWKKLRTAVRALDDDDSDPALHEVRIRAKRARYAAEAVAPVVGRPARRFAKAVAAVQEVLGDHQDAVVAQTWFRDAARALSDDPEAVFVAGELAAAEAEIASRSRSEWASRWRAARRPALRNWM